MATQNFAAAEDQKFFETYGAIDQATRDGIIRMLSENLPQDAIAQSWNCQASIPLRSAFMQGVLLDAWRWRNQPKQAPAVTALPRQEHQDMSPVTLTMGSQNLHREPRRDC